MFRGIGRRTFGLYQYTPKQKLKKAVDELVKEIEKFNEKTQTYSQYDINEDEAQQLKTEINKARENFELQKSLDMTKNTGQAIGTTLATL